MKAFGPAAWCAAASGRAAPSILFVNRVYPPQRGATGRLLRELAVRMAAAGWRVTVVTDGLPGAGDGACPGVTVARTGAGAPWPGAAGYAAALVRLTLLALRQPRHDLVVTMTDPPLLALAGPLLALRHGAALHWCHDLYPELFALAGGRLSTPLSRLLTALSTAALRRHAAVVAIGDCMARRLAARGVPGDRIQVLPNWAQPDLRPAAEAAGDGDAGRPFTVLYAGTLGLVHPVGTLAEAARTLAGRHPAVRLVIVAEGRRRAELEARTAGLPNLILLPHQAPETLRALAADVDLHLALLDGRAAGLQVPCKVAAALASGRPVILAGPVEGDAARMLRESGAGWIVPPDDGPGLADLIGRLAADPALVAAAADAARAAGVAWTADLAAARFGRLCAGLPARPRAAPAMVETLPTGPLARPEAPGG